MNDELKLTAADVRYLSMEGGGGKGVAYLGAFAALSHPEIGLFVYDEETDDYYLERRTDGDDRGVEGVAGASAGAIMAALVASGWGLRGIRQTLVANREELEGFFDSTSLARRRVPVARPHPIDPAASDEFARTSCQVEETDSPQRFDVTSTNGRWSQLQRTLTSSLDVANVLHVRGGGKPTQLVHPAVRQLLRHPRAHLRDLFTDFGLFSGCDARAFIDRTLSEGRFVSQAGESMVDDTAGRSLTFAEHRRRSGVELVVTGTNLRSGRGEYLSARHGPSEMAVADAVRISMGIPVVFKPVRIDHGFGETGWARSYDGLWVDGGVLNNNPIHAFDTDSESTQGVLGLRLGEDSVNEPDSFVGYLGALVDALGNAAERQPIRSAADEARTVVLPVPPGTLSTLDFTPDDAAVHEAGVVAAAAVLRYFEVDANPERVFEDVFGAAPTARAE